MVNEISVSQYGSIIVSTIEKIVWDSPKANKYIACFMTENVTVKGSLIKSGKANDSEYVYGIQIDDYFPFCIKHSSKCADKFGVEEKFMIIVKDTIGFVDIDKDTGAIMNEKISNEVFQKYKKNDFVLVLYRDEYKAAKIISSGTIEGIVCHEIELADKSIKRNERRYIVLDEFVKKKLLNNKGFISYNKHLQLKADNTISDAKIGSPYNGHKCLLRWKGLINGLECVGMDGDHKDIDDFNTLIGSDDAYWTIIPLEMNLFVEKKDSIKDSNSIEKIKNDNSNNSFSEEHYKMPLSTIDPIEYEIFKADDDAKYIYTIVNSMFIFTEMFDSLICDKSKDICKTLTSTIVMPIRSKKTVSAKIYSEFAELLNEVQINGDENVFSKFLDSIGFEFIMSNFYTKEDCKLSFIDLSSTIKDEKTSKIKMTDLLNIYCITNKKFLLEPPKCLILGFNNRNSIKNAIVIPSKLDISKITYSCNSGFNICSQCSSGVTKICFECSTEKSDIIYFCKDHKTHCKHIKEDTVTSYSKFAKLHSRIELDLMAIICKCDRKFNAYVKTNDPKGSWMKSEIVNEDLKVQNVDLQSYFEKSELDKDIKNDAENIEKHMCICLYKYAPLEFYWNGY